MPAAVREKFLSKQRAFFHIFPFLNLKHFPQQAQTNVHSTAGQRLFVCQFHRCSLLFRVFPAASCSLWMPLFSALTAVHYSILFFCFLIRHLQVFILCAIFIKRKTTTTTTQTPWANTNPFHINRKYLFSCILLFMFCSFLFFCLFVFTALSWLMP